jgi:CheY-like chemotaxis protein
MALRRILEPEYIVYSADNGKDAVAAAEKYLPDVILLDVMMPDMCGYEVITALKESEATKNILVIFLTSLDSDEEEEKGLQLGAVDYIIKPFSPAIVKLRVKTQLNRLEQLRTIEEQLNEHKILTQEINRQDELLYTVSSVAGILLHSSLEEFAEDMHLCMGMMAEAVEADRVYIWKNYTENDELYCTQIYEWTKSDESLQGTEYTTGISYRERMPEWQELLSNGMCVNGMVKNMPLATQEILIPQGAISTFIAPVFLRDNFWGFIGFDDRFRERVFSENEELILRSAGLLIANSMLRNDMTTDLKSSAEQLKVALVEAQAANVAKSNFLSNMSHEIRTPMNAIIGMGELLQHEQLNERQAGYVGDIVTSANALLRIINDILDISKIESGNFELNPTDYDFNAFVDNIKSMFVYVTQKKGLEFKLERGENLPAYLYGDDIRLRQTLINILGNAVKFTEKGSVSLKVTAVNNSLVFKISDTGIGIHKEDLSKLFGAFSQVDKSKNRNVVGTGLGLSISKAFAEMMGGSIMLESEYGQGTTFTVMIPIVAGNCERIENKKDEKTENTLYAPKAKILVVDDNEFNLKVAHGLLSLQGINAITADSGAKAIDEIKASDFDIVFMDHMMPEMDGVETTARIRELGESNDKYKSLPIIALTANAIFGAKEMFLANGFNDFISKPINTDELVSILKAWLPPERISEAAAETENTMFTAPNARILVTDDDEFSLSITCKYLKMLEIKTRTVTSGAMALKAAGQGKYDIILIDHMMPEMDGVETMQKIREFGGKYETLPLIALTGSAGSEGENMRDEFISKGFTDYIPKPINADELHEVIKRHLPPEKIEAQTENKSEQNQPDKLDELRRKSAVTFVKENQNTFTKVTALLDAGDTKTAHRTMHNLKSAAGFLGKKELQQAAFSLEMSLQKEAAEYTQEQLGVLEKELSLALAEFAPLFAEHENIKIETVQVSADELTALLNEIKPLLESGDFGVLNYAEKLKGIADMKKIAEMIEDYEFEDALNEINKKSLT